MGEKNNILHLCVLMSLSDYDPDKREIRAIQKISKKLSVEFNVLNSFEEIQNKFRDDFETACKFYLNGIETDKNLKDREIKLLELCKKTWGSSFFE
jgi:hypothetical protein